MTDTGLTALKKVAPGEFAARVPSAAPGGGQRNVASPVTNGLDSRPGWTASSADARPHVE